MFIPVKDAYLELTPEEFERYSLDLLFEQTRNLENLVFERYSLDLLFEQTRNLENLVFEHNRIIEAHDGNYQIDGYIELCLKYKTLVECKHYKSAITREKVRILHTKI